uniref:KRAB domain-containing protein n=1 Tax=Strigops habroptila TaxID=2489341 RepID=A0A672TYU5_STRHB
MGLLVTFEDIVVHFSGAEWASLDDGQKELYRTVMEDNYEMLVSLALPGAGPSQSQDSVQVPLLWEPSAEPWQELHPGCAREGLGRGSWHRCPRSRGFS